MLKGIGVDLCKISRIERALKSEHFRDKIFSPEEKKYCEAKGSRKFESYAACFAAREAFCKAAGLNLMLVMDANNFSLIHDENGKPIIKLSGELENFRAKIFLSISHEDEYACALVVVENL